MKKHNIIAMALTSLMALPVIAQDSTPAVGDILQGINMFTPEEGDPAYKVKANEKYGTQWGVDMAYGLWNTEKVSDVKRHNNLALLHAQLNQRLIEDKANGEPGCVWNFPVHGGWIVNPHRAIRFSLKPMPRLPACMLTRWGLMKEYSLKWR